MARNVVPFKMSIKIAEETIRRRAAVTSNVIFSTHAKERMEERDISSVDVYRILRGGIIMEDPACARAGEWKVKVSMRLRGSRDASVVTIILKGEQLLVKTVHWDDL